MRARRCDTLYEVKQHFRVAYFDAPNVARTMWPLVVRPCRRHRLHFIAYGDIAPVAGLLAIENKCADETLFADVRDWRRPIRLSRNAKTLNAVKVPECQAEMKCRYGINQAA